jgi:hypothetical protein
MLMPNKGTPNRNAYNAGREARSKGKPRVHPCGLKGASANIRTTMLVSWWLRGFDEQQAFQQT